MAHGSQVNSFSCVPPKYHFVELSPLFQLVLLRFWFYCSIYSFPVSWHPQIFLLYRQCQIIIDMVNRPMSRSRLEEGTRGISQDLYQVLGNSYWADSGAINQSLVFSFPCKYIKSLWHTLRWIPYVLSLTHTLFLFSSIAVTKDYEAIPFAQKIYAEFSRSEPFL